MSAFHDFVVGGSAVEPRQQFAGLRRDNRGLVVGTRERTYGVHGLEPHDSHELDLLRTFSADQVDALKAGNLSSDNAHKDLPAQE